MTTDPVTGLQIPDTGQYAPYQYVLRQYLQTRVTSGIHVSTQIPDPKVARMIILTGAPSGGRFNIALAWRRVIIHTFDLTEPLSVRMGEMVRGYLVDGMFTRGSGFRTVRIIGEPYFFPDPEDPSKTPRAQMTVDVQMRASFTPYGNSGS